MDGAIARTKFASFQEFQGMADSLDLGFVALSASGDVQAFNATYAVLAGIDAATAPKDIKTPAAFGSSDSYPIEANLRQQSGRQITVRADLVSKGANGEKALFVREIFGDQTLQDQIAFFIAWRAEHIVLITPADLQAWVEPEGADADAQRIKFWPWPGPHRLAREFPAIPLKRISRLRYNSHRHCKCGTQQTDEEQAPDHHPPPGAAGMGAVNCITRQGYWRYVVPSPASAANWRRARSGNPAAAAQRCRS